MKKWKRFFKSLNFIDWIEFILLIIVLIAGLCTVFKFLFVGEEKSYTTPVGSYTCRGGAIKVCSGDAEVAEYLGV